MQIDTAGTYLLKYTAEDECGNVTEVTREVVAEQISYRTVLYTDGTFIINEKSTDIDANVAEHGVATNVYVPLDENNRYDFSTIASSRPWNQQASLIKHVEFGSKIQPEKMNYWFKSCSALTDVDFLNLDTSRCIEMNGMFEYCSALTSVDLSTFDLSSVNNMSGMFLECSELASVDMSGLYAPNPLNIASLFNLCRKLVSLNTEGTNLTITGATDAFAQTRLISIDISGFDLSQATQLWNMFFADYSLETIYASAKSEWNGTTPAWDMFKYSDQLVGGAGTRYSNNNWDGNYAHIDGGTSNPGYFTAKPST